MVHHMIILHSGLSQLKPASILPVVKAIVASEWRWLVLLCRQRRWVQHCFLRPVPPNCFRSLQLGHFPQFSLLQPSHSPHLFLFVPYQVVQHNVILYTIILGLPGLVCCALILMFLYFFSVLCAAYTIEIICMSYMHQSLPLVMSELFFPTLLL